MSRPGLILKLSSPDQSGIVAKIATYVAGHNGNLIEFAQFSDQLGSKFFARLEIQTQDLNVEVQDFIAGFDRLGELAFPPTAIPNENCDAGDQDRTLFK